ncbi:2-Pyrone-4,6-dicarboxylate lactonase [Pseudomonas savastanoi pv. phaseolicola 1448A]|uniref:2-Pyrone-4,6-dicarboxylate lactonase n=16 Tax=Pseudomonas syringae group TaxID=136849 RepID=A0A0P9SD59_PSEA0|nr:2-Pyrone-4,6-dicarboxylate lactonase [Pseudomonas savastanoi pv. phaseolicola 1448A]KPW67572.1 2-Pyrone-4,6-dicarboxylate lactonase [Pseudomonas amygdali pv. ciccaronei]KPW78634.1 2-Pyrone-4,6-dicarboxylate lactonase [Pseudomonas syringae pv. cerasicola]KPX24284.1 2-Pyrone-4,6-dicarboxylate lactonase [Pseudomonas amygdali pv. eriobotryae]KPY00609.1 2-Pyrone-4,6-dicarboxylate lactonase [Pseudomonas savastanoi pv. nerii]KPY12622.1 2-Pyrone-4,6-dicarboxylate lactonase [Pseudomonas savastanoi p
MTTDELMTDPCTTPILGIDAHAHVFSKDLSLTSGRRYSPDYDATVQAYLAHLHEHGLSHGVLVQPSFLGTDNRFLFDALAQAPDRLRGVAVVDTDISRGALQRMAGLGIVGIRLNLIGRALPDFTAPEWKSLFKNVWTLGWHVELHREVADLPGLIRQLLPFGCKIVIDHFGRPDARLGIDDPAFQALLELGLSGQLWMKVSAIYRLGGTAEQNAAFAHAALPLLLQSFGPRRLVWGSDWPHTQHEQEVSYASVVEQFRALECPEPLKNMLLVEAPQALFDFLPIEI